MGQVSGDWSHYELAPASEAEGDWPPQTKWVVRLEAGYDWRDRSEQEHVDRAHGLLLVPVLLPCGRWCAWSFKNTPTPVFLGESWASLFARMSEDLGPGVTRQLMLEAGEDSARWERALTLHAHYHGKPARWALERKVKNLDKDNINRAALAPPVRQAKTWTVKEKEVVKQAEEKVVEVKLRDKHEWGPLTELVALEDAPAKSRIYTRMASKDPKWAHYERRPAPADASGSYEGRLRPGTDWAPLGVEETPFEKMKKRAELAEADLDDAKRELERARNLAASDLAGKLRWKDEAQARKEEIDALQVELDEARAAQADMETAREQTRSVIDGVCKQSVKQADLLGKALDALLEMDKAGVELSDAARAALWLGRARWKK